MAKNKREARLRAIESLVRSGVAQKRCTKAVLILGSPEQELLEITAGCSDESGRPASFDSVFDCASLTKPVATASALLLLAQRGIVRLSDRVDRYLPVARRHPLGTVTLRALMTHTGGLPAWLDLHSTPPTRRERLAHIVKQPLTAPGRRYVYSDLGYMLLGEIVGTASGRPLHRFVNEAVFAPLKMIETRFLPTARMRARAVPTEYCSSLRRRLCGIVHDENCRAAGGVSGHAGLFSTAPDLARFCRALLSGKHPIFSRATLQRLFTNQIEAVGGSTCGWFTPPNKMLPAMLSFRRRRIHAIGHTGFTGTSIVMAPGPKLFIVLLTNRVYFGRNTPEFYALRRAIHREFAALCAE